MHVLAAIIAEAFNGYPVTESVRGIERYGPTTIIYDTDCVFHLTYSYYSEWMVFENDLRLLQ